MIDPSGARTQVAISKTPLTIGRLSDNDVLLQDSRISRHHAAIVLENGHYAVEDQNSRHGTFVNGARVQGARPLKNNDRIEFGVPGSYALLFVSEEQSLATLLQRVETPVAASAGTTSTELRSLNLLLEVGRSLHAGLTLEEVLNTVVDACLKVTGTERGFIFLRDPQGAISLDSRLTGQPFSDTDKQMLRSLALQAAGVIENARLFTAARDKERMDQELSIARDIQQALLPKRFRVYDTFQVAGINIPSQQVGGDYYDLIEAPGERYAFVVADVCGKGISAALLTSTLQGALAAMVELGQSASEVARHLNRYLCRHAGVKKFATFFCGVLEPGGRFDYVNAGHVPALWLPRAGELTPLRAGSYPLGLFEDDDYPAQSLAWQPGDTLVLYTDGFTEAMNPAGESYGVERLTKAVEGFRHNPVEELADAILGAVREFAGGTPPGDDMTLLVVRYEGKH